MDVLRSGNDAAVVSDPSSRANILRTNWLNAKVPG